MARKCYHIYDEVSGKKILIPHCWDAVIHGDDHCTCYLPKGEFELTETDKKNLYIKELEKENIQLRRIVNKVMVKRKKK